MASETETFTIVENELEASRARLAGLVR